MYSFLSLFKASKEDGPEKELKKWAEIYSQMEEIYFEKSQNCTSPAKAVQQRGRSMLCRSGFKNLRLTNSSSLMERSFSDCLRAVSDKRSCLRLVLKILVITGVY